MAFALRYYPKENLDLLLMKVLTMTNLQPTRKPDCTKFAKSQAKQQNILRRILVFLFVMQAALIGVEGSFDVLSGKPVLNVLQGMITQGIELIIKAQSMENKRKKGDC